jgi:hypothetical protein
VSEMLSFVRVYALQPEMSERNQGGGDVGDTQEVSIRRCKSGTALESSRLETGALDQARR